MTRILIPVFILILSGCGPGYRWVNNEYPLAEMDDHFEMDKGTCVRESDDTYPDPVPVENPDDYYNECMANTTMLERVVIENPDGTRRYETVRKQGNPYLCTPSREYRDHYASYVNDLWTQQTSRAKYVDSCLSLMGWQQILIEEKPQ
jgi:hypothetical protein